MLGWAGRGWGFGIRSVKRVVRRRRGKQSGGARQPSQADRTGELTCGMARPHTGGHRILTHSCARLLREPPRARAGLPPAAPRDDQPYEPVAPLDCGRDRIRAPVWCLGYHGVPLMSTGEAGYYTAVATAIPVLLVVYVIGVNDFVTNRVLPRHQDATRQYTVGMVAMLRGGGFRHALRGSGGLVLAFLYGWLIALVFVAAVVLPAVGEVLSLRALFLNSASEAAETWSAVGLAAAGVIVVTPLALKAGGIYFQNPPLAFMGRAVVTFALVLWVYRKWKTHALRKNGWARPDVKLSFTGLQGRIERGGSRQLMAFGTIAWASQLPRLGGIRILDADSALALNADGKGAVYLQRRKLRIAVIAAWEDADQALLAYGLAG
jgi:hypothetical protein